MRTASERLESALGNTYRIKLQDDSVIVLGDAREEVNNIVWDASCSILGYAPNWILGHLGENVGWEYVTPQGKITRRIAAYLYKQHGIKLSDDVIQRIGNAAASALTISGEYDVGFVCREADLWRPGDYGDGGSCYFSGRSAAPPAIFEHGGAGVTVHNAECGSAIGRAWIVAPRRKSGVLALWNWYTRRGLSWGMSSLAQLLAQGENSPFHGMEFCPQYWENETYDSGNIVYINCRGYALCEPGKLTGNSGYIDLGIEVDSYQCYACGCGVNDDDAMYFDGEYYCESCYPGAECECCGCEVDRDLMYYVENPGVQVCERCYSEHYAECEECAEVCEIDRMQSLEVARGHSPYTYTVTEHYCIDCYPGETCHHCAAEFHRDEMLIVDDNPICADCMDEHYSECEDCHSMVANADIVQVEVGGETGDYCASCADDHACADCHNGAADVWVSGDRYVCRACYADDVLLVDTSPQMYQLSLVVDA